MNEKSIGMLIKIRMICLMGTFAVIVLAAGSLCMRNDMLRDVALTLSILGTVAITFVTAKVINTEKEK